MIPLFFDLLENNYKSEDVLDGTFWFDISTEAKSNFNTGPISGKGVKGLLDKILDVGVAKLIV